MVSHFCDTPLQHKTIRLKMEKAVGLSVITREEALELLDRSVSNRNLRKHAVAVSAIMGALARRLGGDEEAWALTGLLHDVDYERLGGDMDRHGLASAEMLEGTLPEECLHAIRAHNPMTGVRAESLLDRCLLSADAASGLVVAAALVMPSRRLSDVRVQTLRNKMRDRSFARGVSREQIGACSEVGLELDEFLDIALEAMKTVHDQLGL